MGCQACGRRPGERQEARQVPAGGCEWATPGGEQRQPRRAAQRLAVGGVRPPLLMQTQGRRRQGVAGGRRAAAAEPHRAYQSVARTGREALKRRPGRECGRACHTRILSAASAAWGAPAGRLQLAPQPLRMIAGTFHDHWASRPACQAPPGFARPPARPAAAGACCTPLLRSCPRFSSLWAHV